MAEEPRDFLQEFYLSLGLKKSVMPLNAVSVSHTKKTEPKTLTLLGIRSSVLPREKSITKATSMPLTDVTISPTKKRSRISMTEEPGSTLQAGCFLGSKPKEMSLFSASSMKADENLKTYCLFNAESSQNRKEELKKDARKIKKMRYLLNKERKVEMGTRVSTELDLNTPPCTVTKELTASDIGKQSRLLLKISDAESHILSHLCADDQRRIQEGSGVNFRLYDHDTNTEHDLVLKRMVNTTRSYVFNGAWVKEFVRRRDLKQGQKIGLFWNSFDSRFHFCLLYPAPADQKSVLQP